MPRTVLKVRPLFLLAAVAVGIVSADAFCGRVTLGAGARSTPATARNGDTVHYLVDGLAYEIVAVNPTRDTALIRRGDDVVYADWSDVELGR